MNLVVPAKHFFEGEFGFAVWADGARLRGFVDWQAIGRTEKRACRRKDDPPDISRDHGIEQIQSIANVVPKILGRVLHRLANQRVSGEMHHSVRPMSDKGSLDLLAIRKLAFNKMRPGINRVPMAFTEIIENGNFMPLIEQEFGANAPDIARAANDEDFHWRGKCSVIKGKSKATRQFDAGSRAHLLVDCC
jgi:hypothetical protein